MEITLRRPRTTFTPAEAEAFWQSVVFYSYVPVYADGRAKSQRGAERRPTDEMFEAGGEPFRRVLAEPKPEAVVVCGLALWAWVAPHLNCFKDGLTGKPRDVILYDDGRTVFARVHHPSYVNFNPAYWCPRIQRLFDLTKEPRECGRRILWTEDPREGPG